MKKHLLTLATLLAAATATLAQNSWKLDRSHSRLGFAVSHMAISETEGQFKNFDLKLTSKADNDFQGANINLTADVKSIDTDMEKRDQHLQAEDFFYAEKHPTVTFNGKELKKVKGNNYKLVGDLTMRGVTKPVTLDVVYGGTIKDPFGNTRAGFKVSGVVNRKDFGMTGGGPVVGDDVAITGKIEVTRQ